MDNDEPRWVCISIDIQYLKGNKSVDSIKSELTNIFDKDLCDVVIIADKLSEENYEMQLENYLFVKVKNYFAYIDKLRDNEMVFGVLDTYENPSFLTDEEVHKFKNSMQIKFNSVEQLQEGDIITVKEGYLKNLKGVIIKRLANNKCKVMFKLYTKSFAKTMFRSNLVLENNISYVLRNHKRLLRKLSESSPISKRKRKGKRNAHKVCRTKPRKIRRKRKRSGKR